MILRLVCIGALLALASRADDWSQWLGENRDAVWRESGVVSAFPQAGPPEVWRTPIAPGYSGPSVAKGRVFVTDRLRPSVSPAAGDLVAKTEADYSQERVHCLDEVTGKAIWQHSYPCRYTISYAAGPRVMPQVHDGKVFSLGAEGHLVCLNADNGKVLWSRDFKAEFGIKAPVWGFAGHPLVDGDNLICIAGGQGTTAVAFNLATGKEVWRSLAAAEPGYSSPVIYEFGGKRQLIIFHSEAANGLDPATGKVLWSVPVKTNMGLGVATPRKLEDMLFFTSFYNGSLMLRFANEQLFPEVLWRSENVDERKTTHLNSIIPTAFLEGGHIYGICSYGQLRCIEAKSGTRVWETLQATTSGQPVRWANAFIVKNGDRFFLFNEHGELIIARLSPDGYQEVSRAKLLEPTNRDPGRPVVWSHPAFANRRVYVRNDKEIVCYDLAERAK